MPVVMLSYEMLLDTALKLRFRRTRSSKILIRKSWPKLLQKNSIEKDRIKLIVERNLPYKSVVRIMQKNLYWTKPVSKYSLKNTVQMRCPKKCQKTRAKKQQIEMLIETLLDKTAA